MRKIILFMAFQMSITVGVTQERIKMTKEGGVYSIPCEVNGLPLRFIFDTGASNVSISITEAIFMLKNGYLDEADIHDTAYYILASGDIIEGTQIILRSIKIGNQFLYNVEASVVHSLSAPLLLGQSALRLLGKYSFDYDNNMLIIDAKTDNQGRKNYWGNMEGHSNLNQKEMRVNNRRIDPMFTSSANMTQFWRVIGNNATLLPVSKGTRVRVIDFFDGYWKVIMYDGTIGYIRYEDLIMTNEMQDAFF